MSNHGRMQQCAFTQMQVGWRPTFNQLCMDSVVESSEEEEEEDAVTAVCNRMRQHHVDAVR